MSLKEPPGFQRGMSLSGVWLIIILMVIQMTEARIRTVQQAREVLAGTHTLEFTISDEDGQRYAWIGSVLGRFDYARLNRAERGVVLAYVRHLSGYSRAQVTRLVERWMRARGQPLKPLYRAVSSSFSRRYTPADVALLAEMDREMDTLSGPAMCCILRRMGDSGDARFVRLRSLSVSHLYNLRRSALYQRQRVVKTGTQSSRKAPAIGIRRAPAPDQRPGFIRIDSVHQGDFDGAKGLYHINAVDCVTQWQVVGSVQAISEAFLVPLIDHMLGQFPFHIIGFHSDNGSEYVNHRAWDLLAKLHIEFTKSRPRKSNDNALVECKNGAVIRKAFGHAHIPQRHAERFNAFCTEHLNPLLNFHRPCLFPTEINDPKKPGRIKRIYRHQDVQTPLDKLVSLTDAEQFLRPGISLQALQQQARQRNDLQAFKDFNQVKSALFKDILKRA